MRKVLVLLLCLSVCLVTVPVLKVSGASVLADTLYQRITSTSFSGSVQAVQFGMIFGNRPQSDYDLLATTYALQSNWDLIIRLKRAAEVSGYDSPTLESALVSALNNMPMVGYLPITYPPTGGYLVYQGYEMYAYKYAEDRGISRWNKNSAFQQLASLVDIYGGGFLIAHQGSAEYASPQGNTRYYDEQAEVLRAFHFLENIGVNTQSYQDRLWNHLLNDGWWTGQWFWYRPMWQVWECEMGGFALIISDYLGSPPTQVLSDIDQKLLKNGWATGGWTGRYVINHAENPDGTPTTNELRPGETAAVWRALHALYPYMTGPMQQSMNTMLTAKMWDSMYGTGAFNNANGDKLNGLITGFLMGMVPGSTSLDLGFNEECYIGNDIEFPSNVLKFDYSNHEVTIPVRGAGSMSFLFGSGVASGSFPSKGTFTVTFSSDWNTVTNVRAVGEPPVEYGSIHVSGVDSNGPVAFQAWIDDGQPVSVPTVGYTFTSIPVGSHTVRGLYNGIERLDELTVPVGTVSVSLNFSAPQPPSDWWKDLLINVQAFFRSLWQAFASQVDPSVFFGSIGFGGLAAGLVLAAQWSRKRDLARLKRSRRRRS